MGAGDDVESQPLMGVPAEAQKVPVRTWRHSWFHVLGDGSAEDTAACCLAWHAPAVAFGWNASRGLGHSWWREALKFLLLTLGVFLILRCGVCLVMMTFCGGAMGPMRGGAMGPMRDGPMGAMRGVDPMPMPMMGVSMMGVSMMGDPGDSVMGGPKRTMLGGHDGGKKDGHKEGHKGGDKDGHKGGDKEGHKGGDKDGHKGGMMDGFKGGMMGDAKRSDAPDLGYRHGMKDAASRDDTPTTTANVADVVVADESEGEIMVVAEVVEIVEITPLVLAEVEVVEGKEGGRGPKKPCKGKGKGGKGEERKGSWGWGRSSKDDEETEFEIEPMSTEPFPGMGMRMGHMRRGMDEDRMEECMLEAGPWLCALGALAISVALYTIYWASMRRTALRERFGIEGTRAQDCALWTFCAPCSLAQETRTLMHNNVAEGLWHGPLMQRHGAYNAVYGTPAPALVVIPAAATTVAPAPAEEPVRA